MCDIINAFATQPSVDLVRSSGSQFPNLIFLRYLNVGNWSSSEDSELSDCDDCVSSSGSRRNDFQLTF